MFRFNLSFHTDMWVWGYSSDVIINPFSMTDETKYEITPLWNNPFTYKSPRPTPAVLSVDWTLIFKYSLSSLPSSELFLALDSKKKNEKWHLNCSICHLPTILSCHFKFHLTNHSSSISYSYLVIILA